MSHIRYLPTLAAAVAGIVLEPLWAAGHRLLQSSADREARRFLEHHPNARIH